MSDTSLFELAPRTYIPVTTLKEWLTEPSEVLWFGKLYKLDYRKLSELIALVLGDSTIVSVLQEGGHSTELQDYLVEVIPDEVFEEWDSVEWNEDPQGYLLPEFWKQLEVEVADSIAEVATKLRSTLHRLPSKEGRMLFANLAKFNKQRPSTLGTYQARVNHEAVPDVLVILDVSGSMTSETIRAIAAEVVSLAWTANAHLAIVSNDTFHWEPGTYDVDSVLGKAQYGGTHYETLAPLFRKDWGTVITIADYDSSGRAKSAISQQSGHVDQVLDISLVGQPTFLAECIGTRATKVTPLMVATGIIRW